MTAIAALDHGRVAVATQSIGSSLPSRTILQNACTSSVVRFWSLLEEVVASGRLPAPPAAALVQPFFRFGSEWTVARAP